MSEIAQATPEERLAQLRLTLPHPPTPVGSYLTCSVVDDRAYVAAHGAWQDGELVLKGRVGVDLGLAEAQEAARIVVLNLLGTLRRTLGELSAIRKVATITVLVNAAPSFADHHRVADAASDLLVSVLGPDVGRHARTCAGVAGLPLGVSVVVDALVLVNSRR